MPCVGGQSRFARFARPASAAFLVADGGTGDGVKVRRRVRRPGHRHRIRCAGRIFFPLEHTPDSATLPTPQTYETRSCLFFFSWREGNLRKIENSRELDGFNFNETVFFFFLRSHHLPRVFLPIVFNKRQLRLYTCVPSGTTCSLRVSFARIIGRKLSNKRSSSMRRAKTLVLETNFQFPRERYERVYIYIYI